MDRTDRIARAWRATQAITAPMAIGLLMTFVGLGSHRPAWWGLGVILLPMLAWRGWRRGMRPARWAAWGMALGPFALMLGLELASVERYGTVWQACVIAMAASCGAFSFIAIRHIPVLASALLAWHLLLAAPIDVARQPHPGGPLVHPLQMGLLKPRPTPGQAAQFVEGGCLIGGLEPRWVVTWQSPESKP